MMYKLRMHRNTHMNLTRLGKYVILNCKRDNDLLGQPVQTRAQFYCVQNSAGLYSSTPIIIEATILAKWYLFGKSLQDGTITKFQKLIKLQSWQLLIWTTMGS